jgi:predicted RND superfamily exporter protein
LAGVNGSQGGLHLTIKHLLQRIAKLTYGKLAPITATVFAVMFLSSFIVTLDIKVGNPVEGNALLFENSEYNVAVEAINSRFPGLNTLEVVFEAKDPNNVNRVARQAETIFAMNELQRLLENDKVPPAATLSFADYLPEANRLFSGGNPKWVALDHFDMYAEHGWCLNI